MSQSLVVDQDRAERRQRIVEEIAAFKKTDDAGAMWEEWASERFRLATPWEITHLRQFAQFSQDGQGGYRCRGLNPAGWSKLVEFTNQAREEKRQIPALSGTEENLEKTIELLVTSSIARV